MTAANDFHTGKIMQVISAYIGGTAREWHTYTSKARQQKRPVKTDLNILWHHDPDVRQLPFLL